MGMDLGPVGLWTFHLDLQPMRGAQELKTAMEREPNDLGVRIVTGFVSMSVPTEVLPMIGNPDMLGNLKTIGNVLDSFSSDFAPHSSVVMNGFSQKMCFLASTAASTVP